MQQQEKPFVKPLPWLTVLFGLSRLGKEIVVDGSRLVLEFFGSYEKEWQGLERAFLELAREFKASHAAMRRFLRMIRLWEVVWRMVMSYRLFVLTAPLQNDTDKREERLQELHQFHAQRFAEKAKHLKGALLKIGQFASTRLDILPEPYVQELSLLQDEVPPRPFHEIAQQIQNELGAPIKEVFASFETEPVKAASIGQVHFATLQSGEEVAVKVQYPGIQRIVRDDLQVLRDVLQKIEELYDLPLSPIGNELAATIEEELDYRHEAKMLSFFKQILAGKEGLVVPAVYQDISTQKVLVMERIEGIKITNWLEQQPSASDRQALLSTLLDAYCHQIIRHGAFHADPHPGNFLITPDGKIAFVDFGCCKTFDSLTRKAFFDLGKAILSQNTQEIESSLEMLGFKIKKGQSETLTRLSIAFMDKLVAGENGTGNLNTTSFSTVMNDLKENPVETIPQDFVLLARVFISLGGLLEKYAPGTSFHQVILPYLLEHSSAAIAHDSLSSESSVR